MKKVVCEWARQHCLPQFHPVEGHFVALQELFHRHAAAVAHHILNVEHRLRCSCRVHFLSFVGFAQCVADRIYSVDQRFVRGVTFHQCFAAF